MVRSELFRLPDHRGHHLADFQGIAVQVVDDPQDPPLVVGHDTQVVEHCLDDPLRLVKVAGRVCRKGCTASAFSDDGRHSEDDVAVYGLGTVLRGINGFSLDVQLRQRGSQKWGREMWPITVWFS